METSLPITNFQSRAAARLYTNNRVQTLGSEHRASKGAVGPAYVISLSSAVQSHLSVLARSAKG